MTVGNDSGGHGHEVLRIKQGVPPDVFTGRHSLNGRAEEPEMPGKSSARPLGINVPDKISVGHPVIYWARTAGRR